MDIIIIDIDTYYTASKLKKTRVFAISIKIWNIKIKKSPSRKPILKLL